jgi:putative flippase GtrA
VKIFGTTEVKYVIAGIWNSIFGVVLFATLLHLFEDELSYAITLGFSYPISIVQSHYVQRRFVWESSYSYKKELTRFGAVYLFQFAANLTLLSIAVEILGFPVLISQIVIVAILILISFVINKKWTFAG